MAGLEKKTETKATVVDSSSPSDPTSIATRIAARKRRRTQMGHGRSGLSDVPSFLNMQGATKSPDHSQVVTSHMRAPG